ncbi:hypothetical protein MHTCC0001_34690 [Flavobacteriaceae bacterium MHTCC 0001]
MFKENSLLKSKAKENPINIGRVDINENTIPLRTDLFKPILSRTVEDLCKINKPTNIGIPTIM